MNTETQKLTQNYSKPCKFYCLGPGMFVRVEVEKQGQDHAAVATTYEYMNQAA